MDGKILENYIKPVQLENLKIPNNVFLSPIAGYSDAAFREICLTLGAGLCFTEMVSAKGLYYGSQNSDVLLKTTKSEKIKAVQIFGSDPCIMREVAETKLKEFGTKSWQKERKLNEIMTKKDIMITKLKYEKEKKSIIWRG